MQEIAYKLEGVTRGHKSLYTRCKKLYIKCKLGCQIYNGVNPFLNPSRN